MEDVVKNTDVDLAYLAGLLDGEGCFYIRQQAHPTKRAYAASVRINIRDDALGVLESLQSNFGGNIYRHSNRSGGANAKPTAILNWHGQEASQLCSGVLPFLRLKTDQALVIIEFEELRAAHIHITRGKHYPDSYYEEAERLRLLCKNMKRYQGMS